MNALCGTISDKSEGPLHPAGYQPTTKKNADNEILEEASQTLFRQANCTLCIR